MDKQDTDESLKALLEEFKKELPLYVNCSSMTVNVNAEVIQQSFIRMCRHFITPMLITYITTDNEWQEILNTIRDDPSNDIVKIDYATKKVKTTNPDALIKIATTHFEERFRNNSEELLSSVNLIPEQYKARASQEISRSFLEHTVAAFANTPFLDSYAQSKIKEGFIDLLVKDYKQSLRTLFNDNKKTNDALPFTWTEQHKINLYKYYQDLSPKWMQACSQAKTALRSKLTVKDWKKSLESIEAFENLFEHEDLIDRLPGVKTSTVGTKSINSGIKALILEHAARLCGAPHWAYQTTTLDKNRKQGQTMYTKLKENSRISKN